MGTLLKDMPEHAEIIENNFLLGEGLKDCLNEIEIDIEFNSIGDQVIGEIAEELGAATFEINSDGKIIIADKQYLAQTIWSAINSTLKEGSEFEITNKGEVAVSIREEITDFVNQNYTSKKV